jgi:hypothetical protein
MLDCPQYFRRTIRFHVRRQVARWKAITGNRRDQPALAFYRNIRNSGFDADTWIDILPRQKLIYVSVPKAASTTIRSVLSQFETHAAPPDERVLYKRRCSGLLSPSLAGLDVFHEMASSADTLRFTFVRNPYARLVSAWSNKFAGKPLRRGDPYVDLYLDNTPQPRQARPIQSLSFSAFVHFVRETIDESVDPHWDRQVARASVPGIKLDLVGRVETFESDFATVLQHARKSSIELPRLNGSGSSDWPPYYSAELADIVYRLYEQDFDAFRYSRRIP